ncbi:MAG: tetraacyldisaccharide 4'-kinase [Bacteroidetes bacterium]|nr:tetraacyldisaccharide 4'-kinase [Bacteroidota bacterium]
MMCRNKLFDWKMLPVESYDIPVVSVGNITCCGTGKTPHIEYLIRLLQDKFNVGTLSYGYGRTSKGFVLGNSKSNHCDIGDESLQYVEKFDVNVAVDKNRRNGIKQLQKHSEKLDCILMDDGFQHRFVKPGMSILLTDFHNLYVNDYPLPTGTLREFRAGAERADIIIVTKTFSVFSPITKRRLTDLIKPKEHQQLYFTYIEYGDRVSLPGLKHQPERKKRYNTIVLFTGIANSYPIQEYLRKYCSELILIEFPDHHKYSKRDLEKIKSTFFDVFSKNKVIITTEKDAMRIIKTDLVELIQDLPIFYIPIEVKFHLEGSKSFDKQITDYVRKSKKNR